MFCSCPSSHKITGKLLVSKSKYVKILTSLPDLSPRFISQPFKNSRKYGISTGPLPHFQKVLRTCEVHWSDFSHLCSECSELLVRWVCASDAAPSGGARNQAVFGPLRASGSQLLDATGRRARWGWLRGSQTTRSALVDIKD